MIRVERLARSMSGVDVFRDLTFEIERGECVTVIGASQESRSALLRVLAALLPPTAGRAEIDGVDVATRPFDARRRSRYVGTLDAASESRAAAYLHLAAATRPRDARAHTDEALLALAGVPSPSIVGALPGDERFGLDLAAALASGALALLIDELPNRADSIQRERYRKLLAEARHSGVTVMLSAASESHVSTLSDRTIVIGKPRAPLTASLAEPQP